MDFDNIIFEVNDSIAIVKINRPEKLNALNLRTMDELKEVFHLLKHEAVAAVIITGAGEKAFAAGADITEISQLEENSGKKFSASGQDLFNIIENFGKPVIAAVNGYALGGGCELALACHFRIASDNARFGQPEINLGIIPGYGGTQRLARLINTGRALELILTGDQIDAQEAYRIGLVNKLVPQSEIMAKSLEIAGKIASKGSSTIKAALKAVNSCRELSQDKGQDLEAELFGECCGTPDFKEGTTAFLEKRKPVFRKV